ncbi:hypothetical protein K239x_48300 [Planctomycetes bacterium K23_9]|uniref:Uncharacterized protein n=1 Tax=Stieleria marina TaxID=1930275 RepID=A0A517P0B3_9BACT|nr:hypothetical protein K239x_48300 [Planctomycetes bacterium K23_9]
MRIEQITAAIARLVTNPVGEIARVETFAPVFCLSFWRMRMPLGMSCYSRSYLSLSSSMSDPSLRLDTRGTRCQHGIKRGHLLHQFNLVPALCPAGNAAA